MSVVVTSDTGRTSTVDVTEEPVVVVIGETTGPAGVGLPIAPGAGSLAYYDGAAWVAIAPGDEGDVLTIISGVPTWVTP